MSPRIGPLVLAILSLIARLAGEPVMGEMLALVAYAVLTLVLQRSTSLHAAARTAHAVSLERAVPVEVPSPAAN